MSTVWLFLESITINCRKSTKVYSTLITGTNPIQYIELIIPLTHLSGQSPAENMASIGPRPPSGEVQNTLAIVAKAAEERATEGKILFTPVATYLDQYSRSETLAELPQHQRRAIENFCHDLKRVATRHFDAYIRGSPRPPPPYSRPSETATSSLLPPTPPISTPPTRASTPSNTPTNNEKASYARALKQPAPKPSKRPTSTTQKETPKKATPDDRLFVRLPEEHPARTTSCYALAKTLRREIGIAGKYIKELHPTKTGIAVCPTQDAGQALEALIPKIASWFGENITIEKAIEWQTIRVTHVPRSITVLGDGNAPTRTNIVQEHIRDALTEVTGTTPVQAHETASSAANPHEPTATWLAKFPNEASLNLRKLRLFGMIVNARLLPRRESVIQCGRCFQWHNERSCARPHRCRLCGSTKHLEAAHPTCDGSSHECPPRCIHCHGPHPADDPTCPLRPRPNQRRATKGTRAELRSAGAAARLASRAKSGCGRAVTSGEAPQTTSEAMDTDAPIQRPRTPTTPTTSRAPTMAPVTKKANRTAHFDLLSDEEQL